MQDRKQTFTLRVLNPDVICTVVEGETITDAVRRASGHHPLLGCLGGGCGICRVQITSGTFTAEKMSSVQISPEDLKNGIVLACKTHPTSDLSFTVLGRKPYKP